MSADGLGTGEVGEPLVEQEECETALLLPRTIPQPPPVNRGVMESTKRPGMRR